MKLKFQFTLANMLKATAWFTFACLGAGMAYGLSGEDAAFETPVFGWFFYLGGIALALVSLYLAIETIRDRSRQGYRIVLQIFLWTTILLSAVMFLGDMIYQQLRR